MNEITHVVKETTPMDVIGAHTKLVGKILNPLEYARLHRRYKEGKGLVYSDEHQFLGPGNPMPSRLSDVRPGTRGDMLAYWHDRAYEQYEKETGKKPYFVYHPSDEVLINKTNYDMPDELVAKYVFSAKKALNKIGVLPSA